MAGIEFKTRWADLDAYVRQGMDPVAIEPRGRDEEWLIAISPVTVEDPVRWALVRDGDALHIPLVPYQVSPEPEKAFRELMGRGMLARLNRDVARLNLHFENTRELDDMDPEYTEDVPFTDIELIVRVKGHNRQYLLNPRYLGIEHFGELVSALQQSETEAAARQIVELAETVRAMYDLVFPEAGEESGGTHESKIVQQM
jgi:hypothetical protein